MVSLLNLPSYRRRAEAIAESQREREAQNQREEARDEGEAQRQREESRDEAEAQRLREESGDEAEAHRLRKESGDEAEAHRLREESGDEAEAQRLREESRDEAESRRESEPRVTDANEEEEIEDDAAESIAGNDCDVVADETEDEDNGGEEGESEASEGEVEGEDSDGEDGEVEDEDEEEEGDASDEEVDLWSEANFPDPYAPSDEDVEEQRPEDEEEGPEILSLGKTFRSAHEFKQALVRYSLSTGYDIKLQKSTSNMVGAVCSSKEYNCKWRVYCSYEKRKNRLQIKNYADRHICIRSGFSKMLKSSSIAKLFEERLRTEPAMTAVEMAAEIRRKYNLIVTDEQCRKAKTKLTRARRRTHEEQFARIWDYEAEIHRTNEGTIMEIQTIPGPTPRSKQRFDRIYVCFEAQRFAWKTSCRPIIGVDGAFLKWDVKGQLLAAVGRDNRIVPIAWAVVEIENDVNWDWFINHLKRDLGLGEGKDYTFISDKQKGLVKAVHSQLPEAEHRMCARHILGNWKRDGHDMELERLFWKVARSYTKEEFAENMLALRQYNEAAYDSLLRTDPPTWSRAFFKVGSCCNDNLNNLCESFNRTIKEARRQPLLDLLESIRRQCMVRTAKRSVIANRCATMFTRKTHTEIQSAIEKSRECVRHLTNGDIHEIQWQGCGYRVDMSKKMCGCGKWQLNGIPCNHAACVIVSKKLKWEDYVSEYFTTKTWQATYQRGIQPVQGMKLWPRLERLPVLPPPDRLSNRGRPSKYARRKSINETFSKKDKTKLTREHRIMTCSNCREEGHNKSSCSKPSVEPPAKRPKGRPKKSEEVGSQLDSQIGSQGGSQRLSQFGSQGLSQP